MSGPHTPFRIQPALGAEHMKTYEIAAPLATHHRRATCTEVECDAQARGWVSLIDETSDLGQRQAHYIRTSSGRKFAESREPTGLTRFAFAEGQTCFREHHVPLDRPALFIVRDGDWRGNPRRTRPRVHADPGDWVDDFANHQQGIADKQQEG